MRMPFTIAEFHDLIRLLEEHAEWRTELRRVLLSQEVLDLPRTVQELANAQRRTEDALTRLTERMEESFAKAAVDRERIRERMEEGFTEAAAERRAVRGELSEVVAEQREMRQDLGRLKGMGQESFYRDRATAIFGRLLSQGHDATSQVADQLQEARRRGVIAEQEYQDVLAADLLWGGQLRTSREAIVVVLEASWAVGTTDVERAARRAAVVRSAGLRALAVAAGQEWPPNVQAEASDAGVAMVQEGVVHQASWEAALARW